MKEKLKCLLFLIVLVLLNPIAKVKADTYSDQFNEVYMWIPNTYLAKEKPGTEPDYFQLSMITRKSNNQFVYCIEIHADLSPVNTYTGYDYNQSKFANLTPEQWQRIQLLAYYGYGYKDDTIDHSDIKWYSVTQYMIWQTVPHGYDIYFTDTLVGTRITRFEDEMKEMEKLLASHYTIPDFGSKNFEMSAGGTLKLTDKNGVLSKYNIVNNDNIVAKKNSNELVINAKNIGNGTITLTKKDFRFSLPPIIYVEGDSQKVIEVGSYDPVSTSIKINIKGGKISIHKQDSDTNLSEPQGGASLKGAVYGIYKEDGSYVDQIVTDENGYATSDYLPSLGRYYLQEISPSEGYELDTQKYYFDIETNNLSVDIKVKEKVIEREYTITKVKASDKTEILTPEANVTFGIYDINDNLIKTLTTDNDGKITFKLPYGKYILKQLSTPVGFEKMKDYEFEISESGPMISKVFSNAEITARVKIIKVDQDGKIISKAGIKFRIKDLSSGEYVCQSVAYPSNKTYCEFATDENGILITPYPLNSGNYQLEEVDELIDGYLWDPNVLKFSINENADIKSSDGFDAVIELRFSNTEVKGQIEINKIGEKVVIKDGYYTYEQIPLPNIVFGLYDESGNLIDKYVTDINGHINIEGLKLGKYILKELKTQKGYILDGKSYEIELKYKDQYTAIVSESFTLNNYLEKGKLVFNKKDITTGKEIPGVKIEIYTDDNELIFTGTTDENGQVIIDNLFIGKFYIIEIEPTTGYKLNKEKVYFEIKENGEIVKAEMTNEKIKGDLEFTKEDLSTSEPLPNTLIEVYKADNDELVFSGKTDEKGKIIIKDLEYGKYYILEKEAPEGYILNKEKMYFEILEDGEIVKANMTNKIITGTLEFTKKDLSTGESLPNTLIEIYNENDELVFLGKTNEEGKIIIKDLEYGKYYILEKEAPEGYILNQEKMFFEILEDGEIVKATMENEKEEMPDTFNADLKDLFKIWGMALSGIILITYGKKQN